MNAATPLSARPARPPQIPWRRALVYGLGLSGCAAARLLLDRGVAVLAVDDRRPLPEAGGLGGREGFEARPADELAALPEDVEVVITSPGVPPSRPLLDAARTAGLPVLAEVELAYRAIEAAGDGPDAARRIVGITGSNGKSTTTALTGALLASAGRAVEVCGNIGRPLSSVVDGAEERIFVVELSSFQLETVDRFRPGAAALLNLAPDHLDRHGGFDAYVAAKARLFGRQGEGDVAVLNGDDRRAREVDLPAAVRRRLFSRSGPVGDGCYVMEDRVVEVTPGEPDRTLFALSDLALEGTHNLENAMAAALLARAAGAPSGAIGRGLTTFAGLPHRVERVGERAGVRYVDDSKGTNVAATLKSLEGFPDRSVHLILGGRGKGADFAPLREAVAAKARRVYLVGESAAAIERAVEGAVPSVSCGTLDRAVAAAAEAAGPGETVLLSPACASFDQFQSFVDRGCTFQRLARALPGFVPAGGGGGDDG